MTPATGRSHLVPPPASKFLVPWVYKGVEAGSNRGWIRERVSEQAFLEAKEREQLVHVTRSFVSPTMREGLSVE